jgi:hypothetical protein
MKSKIARLAAMPAVTIQPANSRSRLGESKTKSVARPILNNLFCSRNLLCSAGSSGSIVTPSRGFIRTLLSCLSQKARPRPTYDVDERVLRDHALHHPRRKLNEERVRREQKGSGDTQGAQNAFMISNSNRLNSRGGAPKVQGKAHKRRTASPLIEYPACKKSFLVQTRIVI